MVLRIKVGEGEVSHRNDGAPRRPFIYPHRSVRFIALARGRGLIAVLVATLVSLVVGFNAFDILQLHSRIAEFFLRVSHIPMGGWEYVEIFSTLGPSLAPVINIPYFRELPAGASILFIVLIVVLLALSRRFALTRNFTLFLVLLLISSAAAVVLNPTFRFTSPVVTQIWIRSEILIWLLLPWVSIVLFVSLQPSFWHGLAWMLFMEVYAILFSAFRMAFCLGVMHYTGMLFFPMLWFAAGLLSNLMYVLLFYSLSVHYTAGRIWRARA